MIDLLLNLLHLVIVISGYFMAFKAGQNRGAAFALKPGGGIREDLDFLIALTRSQHDIIERLKAHQLYLEKQLAERTNAT